MGEESQPILQFKAPDSIDPTPEDALAQSTGDQRKKSRQKTLRNSSKFIDSSQSYPPGLSLAYAEGKPIKSLFLIEPEV